MIASWAILNPGHTILIYSDADIRKVVEKNYPNHLSLLDGLPSPVERTDLWRYLVICGERPRGYIITQTNPLCQMQHLPHSLCCVAYGGVYADSDVLAAVPLSEWTNGTSSVGPRTPRLIVGLENLFQTQAEASNRGYARQVQWSQWTIAGHPGHPVTCRMGDFVQVRGGQDGRT